MQRKDERAIKYWVKGQLNKPTTDALRLNDLGVWYGGRLLAVRAKSTTGGVVIFVEGKEKPNIAFGTPNSKMWTLTVVGRDFQKLHEIYSVLFNLKGTKTRKEVRADDIRRMAGYIEHLRKLTTGFESDYCHFVPEGPAVRVALDLMKHRYEALAWNDKKSNKLLPERGISDKLDDYHLLFFNFDDAILFKLKHKDIKAVEV